VKSLKKSYVINVSSDKVWKGLTDPEEIEQWTDSPAAMDEKEGTEFKLWGEEIFGKNLEMVKNKKIVQEWYSGKWERPSLLTIEISEDNGHSNIELKQENIPDEELDDIDRGWDDYYFNPLKEYLEKGGKHE
jgi:activator of HSP90 ATPase